MLSPLDRLLSLVLDPELKFKSGDEANTDENRGTDL